jgi:hypothetical protein
LIVSVGTLVRAPKSEPVILIQFLHIDV